MILVVLGMHKSGTTLVSEMLHHSGIDMIEAGGAAGGYDDGNTWERDSTKAINHAILGSAGAYSLRTTARRRGPPPADADDRMRRVAADLSARHADWGFKDPRTCLTYDLWAAALPAHRLVVVYRRPEEGWAHYRAAAGSWSRWPTVFGGFLTAWCEYNAAILAALERRAAPAIVLHYTRLMTDADEFRRLERFLGRPLVDRRVAGMHRSHADAGGLYRLARGWHRLRGGPEPEPIVARLERLRG